MISTESLNECSYEKSVSDNDYFLFPPDIVLFRALNLKKLSIFFGICNKQNTLKFRENVSVWQSLSKCYKCKLLVCRSGFRNSIPWTFSFLWQLQFKNGFSGPTGLRKDKEMVQCFTGAFSCTFGMAGISLSNSIVSEGHWCCPAHSVNCWAATRMLLWRL